MRVASVLGMIATAAFCVVHGVVVWSERPTAGWCSVAVGVIALLAAARSATTAVRRRHPTPPPLPASCLIRK